MGRSTIARFVGVLALAILTMPVQAMDSVAVERLTAAELAYEEALLRLAAAEAELAAARAEVAGSMSSLELDASKTAGKDGTAIEPEPETKAPAPEPEPERPGWFDLDTWEKRIELGMNGTTGNSDNLSMRFKLSGRRKNEATDTKIDLLYKFSQRNGRETENRFRLDVRNDWLARGDSKIRWWAKGTYEYNEFAGFQHRISAHAGFGYDLIKNDETTLLWRTGFGGAQTYGGTNEDFRPEALITGMDFTHKVKEGQKVTAGVEVFMDITESQETRVNTSVDYQILLDQETGMLFRTGIDHRYDTNPGSRSTRSDLDYYMTLGWKF